MPTKYPCGNCGIGVRFSGIKCTGLCKKWYHAGCQNIIEKDLKKWSTQKIGIWQCTNCLADKHSHLLTQELTDSLSLNSSDTIEDLKNSLNLLDNSSSQEDKLEMAAKIGSALVEENELLKEEIFNLRTKLSIMEDKFEELENEDKKHLDKVENLLQLNADIQAQLTKEKNLHLEAQSIYEEHDLKLSHLIDGYVKKITELEKTISALKNKIKNKDTKTKTFQNSATQTSPTTEVIDSPTFLLLGMSDIKTKLDRLETAINTLTSGDSQTCKEKLKNTLTEYSSSPTSGDSQTCKEKLTNTLTEYSSSPTSGDSQTCKEKLSIHRAG
uniref:PHD-type domain-containing protein n=1 Tax=Homalodisca liturata TaxID=320908 RepID=A0A1B6HXS9_9HEMI